MSLDETNVEKYVIEPKKLYIEWGETEYDYDGTRKVPTFNIAGWLTANSRTIAQAISTRRLRYTITVWTYRL